jgi:flagellar basal body rod protein FlgG
MQGNLYVGVSAQVALQRRLETIAHNVANASTVGFRADLKRWCRKRARTPWPSQ